MTRHDWPTRQPWRMVARRTVVLHPDTGRPVDLDTASSYDLDRCWTALDTWATRHHGTLIATRAAQVRGSIEAAADRRRASTAGQQQLEAAA